jgi:pyridoxine/pyridoxamine 5'-phosphate oxidase
MLNGLSEAGQMIPTNHDYYNRRAREHRALASAAKQAETQAMHERLVKAYVTLAGRHPPRPQHDKDGRTA